MAELNELVARMDQIATKTMDLTISSDSTNNSLQPTPTMTQLAFRALTTCNRSTLFILFFDI